MIKHLHILAPKFKRTIALTAAVLVTASSLFAFPDFEEAKSEADQGDAQAQAVVATYYALGWQTGKDPALAAQYAKQSANAGNPLGKFRLGALVRNGEGVAKDEVKIPIDSMKDVNSIECKLDFPSDFQFTIKPASEN